MSNQKHQQARQTLCLFLKTEAIAKGLSQQDLADKCGWHQQTVQRILSGKISPTLDNFIKLADAVGVNFFMQSKDSTTLFEQAMTGLGRRKATDKDKLN